MTTSLPADMLPSDDWAVMELSEALAELLPGEPLPGQLSEGPPALAGVCRAGFARRGPGLPTEGACGPLDLVPPGGELADLAQDAWDTGLERLSDDRLIGLMLAWRRLASWAGAGELAAVAELDRRRQAQVAAGADTHLAEHVTDEVAAALTLTGVAAGRLVDLADQLGRLPATRAALAAGLIDQRKAAVIADETSSLGQVEAAAAEHLILPAAPSQTTGQLRAAARRAAVFMDPTALVKRREEALKEARVEVWGETAGTAALAGRDLPAASALAASKNLSALAHQLKDLGADGTIDQLRAHVYTALLLGQSPASLLASAQAPAPGDTPGQQSPPAQNQPPAHQPPASPPPTAGTPTAGTPTAGTPAALAALGEASAGVPAAIPAGLGGSVNLTMPLATLLGGSLQPGEVPGYGFVPAEDCRTLATAMTTTATTASTATTAGSPRATAKTRWCLTLTGNDGQALAHGCATGTIAAPTVSGVGDWALTFTIRPLATISCDHHRESQGYRPAPSLRHLITIRQRTCSFPGCRRPATRCDLDHTIAHQAGGRTCECNLAPLCRRHHQAKQAQGWHLEQPWPGTLTWTMPHGRKYVVRPGPYP